MKEEVEHDDGGKEKRWRKEEEVDVPVPVPVVSSCGGGVCV